MEFEFFSTSVGGIRTFFPFFFGVVLPFSYSLTAFSSCFFLFLDYVLSLIFFAPRSFGIFWFFYDEKNNHVIAAIFASCIPNQYDNWHNPRIGFPLMLRLHKHVINSIHVRQNTLSPRCALLFFLSFCNVTLWPHKNKYIKQQHQQK